MRYPAFILAGDHLIAVKDITFVDFSKIEEAKVIIHHSGGVHEATGFFAFEAMMALKPSAMEGRRLRWQKNVWAVHNLIGHPVLQILAYIGNGLRVCRLPKRIYQPFFNWGMWVHDATVPKPIDVQSK